MFVKPPEYVCVDEFVVCQECGSSVLSQARHNEFHVNLEERLNQLSRGVASAQSAADPRHWGL